MPRPHSVSSPPKSARFEDSEVEDGGGVMYGAGDSQIVIKGGNFTLNYADEVSFQVASTGARLLTIVTRIRVRS